jgi:Rod binding domain-containing protein
MKPLNESNALGSDGDDEDTGSGGALGEFASEALGRALSDHGGFGMATRIVQQLTPAGNHKETPAVTKNLHIDTVMKTS